jgi:hypothetical protein
MKTVLASLLIAASGVAMADDCTHLMRYELKIDPVEPKGYVGDSFAAYAQLGYHYKPNLAWRFEGEFPRARFMSAETYVTMGRNHYDVRFDHEIDPSSGSYNPFRDGTLMESNPRKFELNLIPREGVSVDPNIIHISPTEDVQSFYYRIFVPSDGITITEKDFPRIFSYDVVTGQEMPCPKEIDLTYERDDSQSRLAWVLPRLQIKFHSVRNSIFSEMNDQGLNAAIPDYLYAFNRVRHGDVTVVRFKAPNFFDTGSGQGPFSSDSDVRYWSLCTQNIMKGKTLNCLPDFAANIDSSNMVTVVIGPKTVKKVALDRGYSFLEDKRASDQKVQQFLYRNLLPTERFEQDLMYQGEYRPVGSTCTANQFLRRDC